MAHRSPERFEQMANGNVEKVHISLLRYMKSDNPQVIKACLQTLRRKHVILRDMIHAGLIDVDGKIKIIIRALDTIFYNNNRGYM